MGGEAGVSTRATRLVAAQVVTLTTTPTLYETKRVPRLLRHLKPSIGVVMQNVLPSIARSVYFAMSKAS